MTEKKLSLILSGRNKEELLKEKIKIFKGTDKEKIVEVPKMKTKQIAESLKVLKEIEWTNIDYSAAIEAAIMVLPKLTGINEEELLEIELEDWEVLFVQFEARNEYFLLILNRTGILPKIKEIGESFGIEVKNTSERSG